MDMVSYKDFLLGNLEGHVQNGEMNILREQIQELPDGKQLCHGPWQYDVARTYYLLSAGEVEESDLQI